MNPRSLLVFAVALLLGALGVGAINRFYKPERPIEIRAPPSLPEPDVTPVRSRREPVYPAASIEPRVPSASVDVEWAKRNRDAIELLDDGEYDQAIALFEQCRAAIPGESVFAANLAEALARLSVRQYDSGDADQRAESLVNLRRASELAPDRDDLRQRLAQLERLAESERGFWTDESEHFALTFDGERDELLRRAPNFVQSLERIYMDLGDAFRHRPVESGRAKIRVVLYRQTGFHAATGMGHWAGGVYDGSVRVPVEDLAREAAALDRVLRHEIAHAFVHSLGGNSVPGWLNEGVAQWLETGANDRALSIATARARLVGKTLIPLADLKKSLSELGDADRIAIAYAEAVAFVGHLEQAYGDDVLLEMIAGCRAARACDAVFEARTGIALETAFGDFAATL
ncbi:MAG: peptidase MA family metallohydrolase [Planctomycetota bacterium]